MAYNFLPLNRDQMYLIPPSLREWLPEKDLAWFVIDAVSQMSLKKFRDRYRADGCGNAAYDPSMMVSLLLYSYCMGERSSRRIERLCERDVAYRVIAANQAPDHATIARFRQACEQELGELFTQVLKLCTEAGLVKVGLVALDGTKIKANAALAANRTHASIEEEVQKWLKEAQATDEEEDRLYGPDRRGDELPPELTDRRSRLARLKECKERLEREAAQAASEQQAKVDAAKAEEAATGKKRRGRKPKAPDPTPEATAKANVSDPDSRIMKTRSGYVQGYNAQAVVTEGQIIVAAGLTQEENDVRQLHPMLAKTKDWKQRKALQEQPAPRGRIPANLPARERMERKLLTKRGRALYKKRSQTVEPVFGQIKDTRGCDRFMRRGQSACDGEWKLICATHNVLKLWRNARARVNNSGWTAGCGTTGKVCWT